MELELRGKVVLITGGSRGIGFACAQAFAAEGARVAIVSRTEANLDAAREALGATGFECLTVLADLTEPDAAKAMVATVETQLGPIDVLVNCAGAAKRHTLEEYRAETWRQGMNAKYFPYMHALDAVRPGMMGRRRGAMVNVIGVGGKRAQITHLAGGAANAALMLVTAGLAQALGPYGIRVNAINPALTFTDRLAQAIKHEARAQGITEDEARARGQAHIPLGRYATPDEVAAVVLFLASSQASYVTGAVVPMDGGAIGVI